MNTRPELSVMSAADVEGVAALHAESWRAAYRGILPDAYLDTEVVGDRHAVWRARFSKSRPTHFGFVAQLNGTVVGFVYALGANDATYGTLIDNLHVAPQARHQGLARSLLLALCDALLSSGHDGGIYLEVFEDNVVARRLYERLGARKEHRVKAPAPGGAMVWEWQYVWPALSQLRRELLK